jgi:hypothetical protein
VRGPKVGVGVVNGDSISYDRVGSGEFDAYEPGDLTDFVRKRSAVDLRDRARGNGVQWEVGEYERRAGFSLVA